GSARVGHNSPASALALATALAAWIPPEPQAFAPKHRDNVQDSESLAAGRSNAQDARRTSPRATPRYRPAKLLHVLWFRLSAAPNNGSSAPSRILCCQRSESKLPPVQSLPPPGGADDRVSITISAPTSCLRSPILRPWVRTTGR